ncbi:MAG: hypothetical protein DMG01_03730 [Acidobacteria bacterium]|nr:MAG: hypothetical protein DMG01_03730 [Acidobacteriota bacterium]
MPLSAGCRVPGAGCWFGEINETAVDARAHGCVADGDDRGGDRGGRKLLHGRSAAGRTLESGVRAARRPARCRRSAGAAALSVVGVEPPLFPDLGLHADRDWRRRRAAPAQHRAGPREVRRGGDAGDRGCSSPDHTDDRPRRPRPRFRAARSAAAGDAAVLDPARRLHDALADSARRRRCRDGCDRASGPAERHRHQPLSVRAIVSVGMFAAVVFDFDGVLIDSESPGFESHRRLYEQCGAALTVEEWCGQIGTYVEGEEEGWYLRLCERTTRSPERAVYEAERRRLFEELVPREPMRGIRDLLAELDSAGVPLAIASTAPARWVVTAAERIGVRALFRAIVTGDEVARRKPAPDVYLEAARRLGVDPSKTIAIEDSAPGIASARAAGMQTVVIPHWLTELHDLSGADLRVAHAGELSLARLATLVQK